MRSIEERKEGRKWMLSVRERSRCLLSRPPTSDGTFRRPAPRSRRPRPPGHTRHRHRCDGPGEARGSRYRPPPPRPGKGAEERGRRRRASSVAARPGASRRAFPPRRP
ncbi:zinc finger protein 318-like isoform X2 [Motacilla alba alba]|uniref:zinc finger protein 318-like isoform X2 n=1 Tax=Motacilla alba alba TaxID=1094192 RepID=UPI0018D4E8E2|nr:zinc finger protein 318-like isoform X2 [Motacilla alba alba]